MSSRHQKKGSRGSDGDFVGGNSRGLQSSNTTRSGLDRAARPKRESFTVNPLASDDIFDPPQPEAEESAPQNPRGRAGSRATHGRTQSQDDDSDDPAPAAAAAAAGRMDLSFFGQHADQYTLPPTVPSPFAANLQASLDALTAFGRVHPVLNDLVTGLQGPHDQQPNWAELLQKHLPTSRQALNELFLLVTRTLIPNQVAENREECKGYYDRDPSGGNLQIIVRYDAFFRWKKLRGNPVRVNNDGQTFSFDGKKAAVADLHPYVNVNAPVAPAPSLTTPYTGVRPLLPNTISTLIFATRPTPTTDNPHGYSAERNNVNMAHHVTILDEMLFTSEQEVQQLLDNMFQVRFTVAVQQMWMKLRHSNEQFRALAAIGYEGLVWRPGERTPWSLAK
ncbi:hypothetical protein BDV96DRAFT_666976 [Lophiotrema nucula]|uniref:Uncharacterized protein n=1 Tax=Lophiotrema nucula TaxID=690887 RepID=A0A6A5YV08_9PLEO|nr:hypothetical protein BDV96DRAFT_666976 [Lophiotrema nucula]